MAAISAAIGVDDFDMRRREFVDKTRRLRRLPKTPDAPIGGEIDFHLLPRARQSNIGEATFLLQTGASVLIERTLVREKPFFPAREEYDVELEPLRSVKRHNRYAFAAFVAFDVEDESDMFEEGCERREFLHRTRQLFQILEPTCGVGGSFRLPHIDITALLENDLGKFFLRLGLDHRRPAVE